MDNYGYDMDNSNCTHNTKDRKMGRNIHNMAGNMDSISSQKSKKNGDLAEYSRYSY